MVDLGLPSSTGLAAAHPVGPPSPNSGWGQSKAIKPENAVPAPRQFHESTDSPKPLKRILIVDDDCDTLASLAMMLAEHHEVGVAADATSAMRRLQSQTFDLILLDLRLPDLDPNAVVGTLRQNHSETPILLMSAHAELPETAQHLRITTYLEKPFTLERLESAVGKLIGPGDPAGPRT